MFLTKLAPPLLLVRSATSQVRGGMNAMNGPVIFFPIIHTG